MAQALPPSTTVLPEVRTATPLEGSVLESDGRRYRVGQAGDAVLVGDWDCDGRPTPALFRPATGEVFVFPRWIDDGRLAVEAIARVDGARALLGDPALVLLDEPTRSLDAEARERLWQALERRTRTCVVMATHLDEDVKRCGRRVDFPT